MFFGPNQNSSEEEGRTHLKNILFCFKTVFHVTLLRRKRSLKPASVRSELYLRKRLGRKRTHGRQPRACPPPPRGIRGSGGGAGAGPGRNVVTSQCPRAAALFSRSQLSGKASAAPSPVLLRLQPPSRRSPCPKPGLSGVHSGAAPPKAVLLRLETWRKEGRKEEGGKEGRSPNESQPRRHHQPWRQAPAVVRGSWKPCGSS